MRVLRPLELILTLWISGTLGGLKYEIPPSPFGIIEAGSDGGKYVY